MTPPREPRPSEADVPASSAGGPPPAASDGLDNPILHWPNDPTIAGCNQHCHRAEAAGAPLREALLAITKTVYSDDAPLDSPSYSALHLECVRIARAALATTSSEPGHFTGTMTYRRADPVIIEGGEPAPAPLDVEALRNAMYAVSEQTRAVEGEPEKVAAEYTRLTARAAATEPRSPIVEVVGRGDGTMDVRTEDGMRWHITEAEYLAWPRAAATEDTDARTD